MVNEHAQPTVHDVAVLAGVSPMTVSRVLAGGKNVRADKIEAVQRAVASLGYRRNENARSLRPGQASGLVGVVITNVSNPYYAEVQCGIDDVLSERGLRILVGDSGERPDREERLVSDFVGRQVDGLIVVPSGATAEHLSDVSLPHTPVVLASRQLPDAANDAVVVDDESGAAAAIAALLAAGHRRIAFVGSLVTISTSQRRLDGYRRAHADAGVEVDESLVRGGEHDPETARRATLDLLDGAAPPTAIFAANNRNTVGVIRALAERNGGRLPERSQAPHIVSFDDFEFSDLMPFALTIIDHDARDLGREAARLLLDRMDAAAPRAPRIVRLPTTLRRTGGASERRENP